MKKINVLIVLLLMAGSVLAQTNWALDKSHSKVGFAVTHMVVAEVEGKFNDFEGKVVSNSEDFNGADVEFTAKVASIDTDSERRDSHLKSDDFFNAEKFPEVKFKGKLVKENGKYLLKGDFTMRDVTKPVSFDVTYGGNVNTGRGMKAGFKINGTIKRFDYGLKWNSALESGSLVVADDVQIICKIELNKQA
ncbi:MAG: YceI family protein [Cyclobacteriaceae bacterium]